MNNIKIALAGGFLSCVGFAAYSQYINPMTEAVMRNYSEILAENPQDYLTLYDRAQQYFELGEIDRALSDVDMALEYTPEKDKDYKEAEYLLKGDILTAHKKYEEAKKAINSALSINSVSQSALYKLGNLNLLMNNPSDALRNFQALQRENPRSQEAFYGMAKANALMGNKEEVENLIKQIELLGKQSYVTYCRIGDLYSDMGNIKDATTNYAIAYSLEDENVRPIESLKLLTKKNPEMVMATLDEIIASKPENVTTNYLKAILAFEEGLYPIAEQASVELSKNLEEESSAIYRLMALSQHYQNKNQEALNSIKKAEQLSPKDLNVLLDKIEILLTIDPQSSFNAAQMALEIDSEDAAVLMGAARSSIMNGKYSDALTYLNSLILNNPSNIEALLLRGLINTDYLNDGKAGIADYTRAGNIKTSDNLRDMVLVALAKSKINKKLDADGLIKEVCENAKDKEDYYIIAVYYAQTGNLEKAKEYRDKALANGYANLYNIKTNEQPLLNLKPIQHLKEK